MSADGATTSDTFDGDGEPTPDEIREAAADVRAVGFDDLADWLEDGADRREERGDE